MAGILDTLSASLTPDVVGQLGGALGIDATSLSKGLGVAAPAVLGSLSKQASTPAGASSLLSMLPQDAEGDFLGNLMNSVTGGAGGTSADLMTQLLGSGANAIGGTLSQKLGFDVRPMLKMAVPMVAGLITKAVASGGLNASGLASMLKTESDDFTNNPANKELSGFIDSALQAGDQAAALRNSFSDAEWMKVRAAPMAAVYLVGTASPSSGAGAVNELAAAAGAVNDAVNAASPTSLIGAGFGGGMTKAELDRLAADAPPHDQILSVIHDGLALVKQKSPSDATAYSDMVMNAANKAAQATKEGGFLGIGGTLVSDAEQQALAEIAGALGR